MKKWIGILLVLTIFFSGKITTFAEDIEKLPSGLNYSDLEAEIDKYVTEHEETTAAVSVGVFVRDKTLLEKSYGYTNIEEGIINDRESVFEWGSCSKLLTWVSVIQLVEKGAIDLEKDIRTYLPEGFLRKLKYDTPITMLNLMNHNAGWQETITDLFLKDKDDFKGLGETLKLIEPEQVNKPGAVVAYSNWGSALAGYIVERVSGQSFSEYVHDNIFRPLGMKHTALNPDLSDNEWVLEQRMKEKCYTSKGESLGTSFYYISLYPAGMATGTIEDFMKFASAFVPKAGNTSNLFQSNDTLNAILSPSLYYSDGTRGRNCHGFWTDELGVTVLWHNGATVGSSSWLAFDPISGTGIVILTNQSGESIYNSGLLPFVFGNNNVKQNAENVQDISGMYINSRSCFKGYAKLYSLFSIIELKKNEDGGYTIPGMNGTVMHTGHKSYLMDMGGRKQFIIYSDTDADGRTVLQWPGSDYVEINGYGVLGRFALLMLLVIAALYCLIGFLIRMVSYFRNKKFNKTDGYDIILYLSVITVMSLFVYIAITLFGSYSVSFKSIQWCFIVIRILSLIPIVYAVNLAIRWKSICSTKRNKLKLIINCIIGLIMTYNVFFWEAYKFW